MLVIRRHEGQTVLVGDDVEIVIIECGGRRVKLGFRAPRQVAVTRGEVKLTREQNLAASQPVSPAALLRGIQQDAFEHPVTNEIVEGFREKIVMYLEDELT